MVSGGAIGENDMTYFVQLISTAQIGGRRFEYFSDEISFWEIN